jgi:hypothetical protein
MPARQAAGLGASGRRFSGGVTVYLVQKTTVYRQVYRHDAVDLAGRSESTLYTDFLKTPVISMGYGRPKTH